MATPTVVLIGTLDTKGNEFAYVRDRIRAEGVGVLLVDTGILGEPLATPDVNRDAVATAAGTTIAALRDAGDRGEAISVMARGAAEIVKHLHAEGRLHSALCLLYTSPSPRDQRGSRMPSSA